MKLTDENRLSIKRPELCLEWNYEKNGSLKPSDVSFGSKSKVWWKCKVCCFEWLASPGNRTKINGTGCLVCRGRFLTDKNRFSILRPEIAALWDYDKNDKTPYDYSSFSSANGYFKCELGHKWERKITCARSCPFCDGKSTTEADSIAVRRPDLIKEWDFSKNIISPVSIREQSSKKINWKCQYGHEWTATVAHRSSGKNCPYCTFKRVSDANRLSLLCPEIAKEWDYNKNADLTPYDISHKSSKKIWWKCSKGHSWQSTVSNRWRGDGCVECGKIRLMDGNNFDSISEAYVYLKLKRFGFAIEVHKKYGIGKQKCDFYIPKFNTYIEVTGFTDRMNGYGMKSGEFWTEYYSKIMKKKCYTENTLKAKFRFIKFTINSKQLAIVRKNME